MWIYCNLFFTDKGVKIQLFRDETYDENHALRRKQTFDTIIPIALDPYWHYYDREITAKRNASITMSLPSFAMFFIRTENRWLELMRKAIEDAGGSDETVVGLERFCDDFENRYDNCIVRYTDLEPHEHDYAWLCLLHANHLQPEMLLTYNLG